jgi:hypothetical protein
MLTSTFLKIELHAYLVALGFKSSKSNRGKYGFICIRVVWQTWNQKPITFFSVKLFCKSGQCRYLPVLLEDLCKRINEIYTKLYHRRLVRTLQLFTKILRPPTFDVGREGVRRPIGSAEFVHANVKTTFRSFCQRTFWGSGWLRNNFFGSGSDF